MASYYTCWDRRQNVRFEHAKIEQRHIADRLPFTVFGAQLHLGDVHLQIVQTERVTEMIHIHVSKLCLHGVPLELSVQSKRPRDGLVVPPPHAVYIPGLQ